MEPFAATSSEPASSSDLFATSAPALEKDVKTQARKVLSLFEEEEERLEDDDGIKNAQKEIGVVSPRSWTLRNSISASPILGMVLYLPFCLFMS